ncbi:hypothetical protein B0H17DRAFT_1145756 [Mycena rosella]|uniref:Uncharacterized protein n=1 Tax=Mycena rosella TaxID=1033263 RepID=A0AAD7G565_MYCRO|nr:hypothetical protein B0H17DRAFT_1145756 [Mycena rosella]
MGYKAASFRYVGTKRKRTPAQKQHTAALGSTASTSSLAASDAGKKNELVSRLEKEKRCGDNYQREVYNSRKKQKRSHQVIANQSALLAEAQLENGQLRAEVSQLTAEVTGLEAESSTLRAEVLSQKSAQSAASKKMHTLTEKICRIPSRIETAAAKAKAQAKEDLSQLFSFTLKEKGVIPDSTRDMINDLVALDGVRPNKVIGVLKRIAGKLGIGVTRNASDRSMQFVGAVGTSKGVTPSSDGTTHKNINLESRRATVINQNNEKQTFFLGIGMAINHTSEKQLEGWEELIKGMYQIYKMSPRCQTADDARNFWIKVTGWHSDHAEDQKKLFRLVAAMKTRLERERRRERTIAQMAPLQWAEILFEVSCNAVTAAGGIAAWEQLSDADPLARHGEAFTEFVRSVGQEEFDKLTPQEKQDVDLFIWGGCCMHKNLNVFKGAVLSMQQWWADNNLPGPLKMFNRDNSAAASLGAGTGAAHEQKIVAAKEPLKSRVWQDTLRYFWDHETGFNICFPDTSNTRFQLHAGACKIIVLHMELLLQFLVYVRENKGSRTLNHMELNVQRGLLCFYTRHEFVVIALLNENIDVPYMLEICGPLRTEDNLLKLGELHKKVKKHLEKIIANPKIVTGSDMTFATATLNGKPWEKAEVWSEDGPISKLSPENIERAWLEVTNDGNESELEILRQAAKPAPNMSLAYHSALRMYKANKTSEYVKTLEAPDWQAIRAQVRKEDASGANKQNKHAQIVHMKEVVDANTKRDKVQKERVEKAQKVIAETTAIPSVEALDAAFQLNNRANGYLTVAALDLQLDWHLANTVKESPSSQESSASGSQRPSRVLTGAELETLGPSGFVEDAAPEESMPAPMDVDDNGYDNEENWYGTRLN